jgi:glucose dehydrogenase
MRSRWFSVLAAGVLCVSFAPASRAQYTVGDWPMYRHNLAGDGFSPLTQINTRNVANLKEAWSYAGKDAQPSTRGVAYWPGDANDPPRIIFTTFDNRVEELDAATGKLVPSFGGSGVITLDVGARPGLWARHRRLHTAV